MWLQFMHIVQCIWTWHRSPTLSPIEILCNLNLLCSCFYLSELPWCSFSLFRVCQISFPFGSQLPLKTAFSYVIHQWEALIAFRFIMVRSPSLDPQPFLPNSISSLAALEAARQHAEIWKVLNNLLVEGTGGVGVMVGDGGKWKMGDGGERKQNTKLFIYRPFCLALLAVSTHTDWPPHPPPTPQKKPDCFPIGSSIFLLCMQQDFWVLF